MQANTSRDTKPELRLRSALHARGMRFLVATRPVSKVRRTADIVFTRARIAVFVDGCFWHVCPVHHTVSKTNAEFWAAKADANQRRDAQTNELLQAHGWLVMRFWEHEQVDVAVAEIRREWMKRTGREVDAGVDDSGEGA